MFTIVTVNNGSVSNSFAKITDSDGTAHEWFTVSAINFTCNSIWKGKFYVLKLSVFK